MQPCVAFPRVDAVEVRNQAAQQEIKGLRTRDSLLDVSLDTCRNNSSISGVMSAVEGLSGVIARMNALFKGRS